MRELLEVELGQKMYWRACWAVADPTISRSQLLARFESVVTNYPHGEWREQALRNVDQLHRMLLEDKAYAKVAATNLAQLPVEQQVRELIFQLRDQTGRQLMNPGRCNIFAERPWGTNTPAHQLARLGYAAVPQLIAALEDQTPSRAVGFSYSRLSVDSRL
jgi:hypothetical protein